MTLTITPPLHPAVPLSLYPGVERPALAAGREALGILYRAWAAVEDGERLDDDEWATAVDGCLEELRRYYSILVATGGSERRAVARTIARIEKGKALLEVKRYAPPNE